MQKYLKKIFIGVFIVSITLPKLIFPFAQKWVDTTNYENRELAIKPQISETAITQYPEAYEAYFNDHLPFQNQLRMVNSALKIRLFHSLDSDNVLLGKEGWLFYKAENCLEDYKGTLSYSEEELHDMKQNMEYIKKWFSDRNIELVVSIIPNKCEVYHKYMPKSVQICNTVSRTQQAVEYINAEMEIPLLYDLDYLIEKSEKQQTYYKYDTHWNYVGGYYGAQRIGKALGKEIPDFKEEDLVDWTTEVFPLASQQEGTLCDLSMMISLPRIYDISKDSKKLINYKPEVQFTYDRVSSYSDVDTMEYHSNAEDSRHLVMIGDSFSNLDIPYLAKEFQECSQIGYGHYEENYITDKNPDIVVFQFVERRAIRFDQIIMDILKME